MGQPKPRRGVRNAPQQAAASGFSVLLLAAGKATRFKSEHSKVLHLLAGKPLGEYLLQAVLGARPDRTYVVVGHEAEQVRKALVRPGVTFIEQMQQLGTGHAVRVARGELERCPSASLIVLVGDAPLLKSATLRGLVEAHQRTRAAATILTTVLENPTGYGRVVRSSKGRRGGVRAIIEEKDCTSAPRRLKEISSGIICFSRPKLLQHIDDLSNDNAQKEYLITDLVEIFSRAGERVETFRVEDAREVLGVNDRVELARTERLLRRQKAKALMRSGVTIVDPETAYVDDGVEVGADTILEPGVSLFGRTRVGRAARIGPWATVIDSALGDRVHVRQGSLVDRCELESDSAVGPFAHVRGSSIIEEGARIGNFVEVKKSRVGRGTKALHLTYLGDATLEEEVNIGAGTVTCNYDGVNKHPTFIERGVFIGSGSMLVAPVRVGDHSYVAAGSTITEDVPPEALALGRARQVNKEGWVRENAARKQRESSKPAPADGTVEVVGEAAKASSRKPREPELIVRQNGAVSVIEVASRLARPGAAKELGRTMRELLDAGHRKIVVNLGGAALIDSAVVGELVAAASALRSAGGMVKLSDVSPEAKHVLEAANLHHFFEIHDRESDAVGSFNPDS